MVKIKQLKGCSELLDWERNLAFQFSESFTKSYSVIKGFISACVPHKKVDIKTIQY